MGRQTPESSVTAGSSGTITIAGTGSGNGSGTDYGVNDGFGAVSAGGSVTIAGTGHGSGFFNFGVRRYESSVTAGSSGTITIAGTGSGNGLGADFGVNDFPAVR